MQRLGDPRIIAIAHEWHGETLRKLERHEDAIAEYQAAVDAGTSPDRVADWSPVSPWSEMVKFLHALGDLDGALRSLVDVFIRQSFVQEQEFLNHVRGDAPAVTEEPVKQEPRLEMKQWPYGNLYHHARSL